MNIYRIEAADHNHIVIADTQKDVFDWFTEKYVLDAAAFVEIRRLGDAIDVRSNAVDSSPYCPCCGYPECGHSHPKGRKYLFSLAK